jgi:hypothetical protein
MEEKTRAQLIRLLLGTAVLLSLFPIVGCDWGVPDFTLHVFIEEGVTGIPETGQYVYAENTVVEFDYQGIDDAHTVEVFLNDRIRKPDRGSIVMFGDEYELRAQLVDIRGDWQVTLKQSDPFAPTIDPFTITLTGPNLLQGDFVDDRGYHGTWDARYDYLVLAYWDWEFYVLTGTVYGMGEDTGEFRGGGWSGTWKAERPEEASRRR